MLAKRSMDEGSKYAQENFHAVTQTIVALSEAFEKGVALDKELLARREELQACESQAAELRKLAEMGPKENEREQAEERQDLEKKLLESASGIRVSKAEKNEMVVELLELHKEYRMSLHFQRTSSTGSKLVEASLSPADFAIDDLLAFSVAINDASFLVSETRNRARCQMARAEEVLALSKKHLVFDDNARVRVTFVSGVIATLETGVDYPLGLGGVHLLSLDTMGVFSEDLPACRSMVHECSSLTQAVQVLAAKFKK